MLVVTEMTRRCSHCCHNGHNSRTCPDRGGVKLFGVRLTDGSIRKSASVGNLSHLAASSASPPDGPDPGAAASGAAEGYASEDIVQVSSSSCRDRKKGEPFVISFLFSVPYRFVSGKTICFVFKPNWDFLLLLLRFFDLVFSCLDLYSFHERIRQPIYSFVYILLF